MSEQFRADTERLRSIAPAFEQLGAEVDALVQRLKDHVAADSAPWGGDDTGRAFAETFVPEEKQTLSELTSLTGLLHQAGPDLRQVAGNFEAQDEQSRHTVRSADTPVFDRVTPSGPNLTAPETGSRSLSDMAALPGGDPPIAGTAPNADPPPAGDTAASPPGPAAAGGPVPSQTVDSSSPGAGQRESGRPSQSADRGAQGPLDSESRSTPQRSGTTPGNAAAAPIVPAAAEGRSPATGNGPVPPAADSARRSVGRATAASDGRPGSPWSRTTPGGDAPRVTAPPAREAETPPPRTPGTPAQRAKPGEPEQKRAVDAPGETPADRLARELADRYNIRAFGFDTPGLPRSVLLELVAAVHDVLSRHPVIELAAIGIDELPDDSATRLDQDPPVPAVISAGTDGCASNPLGTGERPGLRITLASRMAVDPTRFERAVRAEEEAGLLAPGCAQRPVYSSIVRELARALDIAGEFRARPAARRALLAAYLPFANPQSTRTLGSAVAGFAQWRAQLSAGIRDGRFDPAAALTESFTEVVLDAGRASPQARVLHRLLIEAARPARAREGEPGV